MDDELLRGDQGAEQHEQADEAELQIGGADLAIDGRGHLGFVDADDQARLRAGDPGKATRAPGTIGGGERQRPLRRLSESIACSAMADNSGTVSSARPIRLGLSSGAAITIPALSIKTAEMPGRPDEIAHDLRHPVEIDGGDDDRIPNRCRWPKPDRPPITIGRSVAIANRKSLKTKLWPSRAFLKIPALAEVDADQRVVGRALDVSIPADDRQAPDPRQVDRQACPQHVATAAHAARRGADIGGRLQHRLDRGDDFALGIRAMLGEVGKVLGGLFDLPGAGIFERAGTFQHQRRHQDQRQQGQSGANPKKLLEFGSLAIESEA